jgi:predicted acylesterase/phospholipase RssA
MEDKEKEKDKEKERLSLVFDGAAELALVYIGALERMSERSIFREYDVTEILGSSSGSLIALILCLGVMDVTEVQQLIDMITVEDDIYLLKMEGIFQVFDEYGIDDGANIIATVSSIFVKYANMEDMSFQGLADFQMSQREFAPKLRVMGTNICKHGLVIFDADTTPQMSVALAIRISTSVPIMYKPVVLNGDVYVDGCIANACPATYCDHRNAILALAVKIQFSSNKLTWDRYINMLIETTKSNNSDFFNYVHIPESMAQDRFDPERLELIVDDHRKTALIKAGYEALWEVKQR